MAQREQLVSPAPSSNIFLGPLASCSVCFGFARCFVLCVVFWFQTEGLVQIVP